MNYDAEKHRPCTAYDCMAIAYVIANSQISAPLEIDFSNCGLGDKLITSVVNTLTKGGSVSVKQLFLDENRLSGNGISCFNEAPSIFRSLKLLSLSQNPLGASGFMELERVVSAGTLSSLRWLRLQGSLELVGHVAENHLSVSFWKALSIYCPKLNIVNLVESDHIDHFDLEGISLGLKGAVYVCKILSNDVRDKDYVYSGCIDLSSCQLTATELPNTEAVNSRVISVASDQLLQLAKNRSITSLHLDKNDFTGDRIHILVGFMSLCPCLEFLYTRKCNINSIDIKQVLSESLLIPELDRWALDDNQIKDDGVEVFLNYGHSLRIDDEGITFSGNPLSHEKFKWLEDHEGQCLSQIKAFTNEQCEVDTRDDEEDSDTHEEEIGTGENLSDEEQSSPTSSSGSEYLPSQDLENEEGSEDNSDSDENPSSEDNYSSSQDVDDRASSGGDEPSSQDKSYSPNEDSPDNDESSSEDESKDVKTSASKKIKLDSTQRLQPSDLAMVQDAVWEARPKWYNLGLELSITPDTLDTIQIDYHDTNSRFRGMLREWLKCHDATWSALANALKARCLGYADLADELPPK